MEYTNDTLGRRAPRKGKKVPRPLIRELLQRRDEYKLCLEGPHGVGKTALL